MHLALRLFYSLLGVLPLASSTWLRIVLTIYSWTLYLSLTILVNYFEILFDVNWIKTGQNVVTGCLGTIVDFFVYISLFHYNWTFTHQRSSCQRMVDVIRTTDKTLFSMAVFSGAVLGTTLYQYSISLLYMPRLFKPQLYKAWIYVFLSYDCFLIVLQFCAILDSKTARINSLKHQIKPHTATSTRLRSLIAKKDECSKSMSSALKMYSTFIILTCLDVFCRSVHYLYIVLWGYIQSNTPGPFIFFMPFAVVSGVKLLMLVQLTQTCYKAKKSVGDFNRRLFNVVLERKDLRANETLQVIVTRWNFVEFSPGGFYQLGKGFLVSTLNSIAVYLTVLVQVSNLKSA
ncbi:hypothetical protein GE061_007869 [Apolygus lucorum]|uniref:Gustatory receptor n=1 Tax=Apolygus lucorum TaxID=248454 RepID=A0A8S9WMP0_APOLU|nr:hypothetical protein GE061_007869 [Apolygus lucorum]